MLDKGGKLNRRDSSHKKKASVARKKTSQFGRGKHAIDKLFRSVTETATDAIISITGDENIILWNHAAEQMFGYSSEEAVGQPITIIMPDRFRQAHKKGINRFFSTGQSKIVGKHYKTIALKKKWQ